MKATEFRGLRKDGKGWAYGVPVYDGKKAYIIHGVVDANDQFITIEEWQEVIPETVGQFTGLHENAFEDTSLNNPIYEDDNIRFIDGEILTVEWNDDTCAFQFSDGSPLNDMERYATHKEVIGKIHEQ